MAGAASSIRGRGVGGIVQRVDAPWPELLVLTLRSRPAPRVLWVAHGRGGAPCFGLGLRSERPRGAAADGFVISVRRLLVGARWVGIDPAPGGATLEFVRGGDRCHLRLARAPKGAGVWLESEGRVLAARGLARVGCPPPSSTELGGPWSLPEDLTEAGVRLLEGWEGRLRAMLRRDVRRVTKRLRRRLEHIADDLRRAERAESLRREGELLLAAAHGARVERGRVVVMDWYAEPPRERTLTVEDGDDVPRAAARRFARARKLERGGAVASRRRAQTEAALGRWEELGARIECAQHLEALMALAEEMGVTDRIWCAPVRRHAVRSVAVRRPWRTFLASSGKPILVGRGGRDNEALTFERATPHDLWLHVRDHAGAHVVVPLRREERCSEEDLLDAATLAVHFSTARGERRAEVQVTRRKFVRRARGGPRGSVLLDRARTLWLRVEPARLRRLLDRNASCVS